MITGFEQYTDALSDYEADVLLPLIVKGMETKQGQETAVTNQVAVKKLRAAGYDVTGPRFRKLLHVIRVSGMVEGIIATSKGYYLAQTPAEWEAYLTSLRERIEHIQSLHDALADQYDNWQRERQ